MQLHCYHDQDDRFRTALIASEGRKWMQVVIVKGGRLSMIRRPMTDKDHMEPMLLSRRGNRKAKASLRRLARKPGTSSSIRGIIKHRL